MQTYLTKHEYIYRAKNRMSVYALPLIKKNEV